MSYRGSSSKQASEYKKQGHRDEQDFAKRINAKVILGQAKKDVIDNENNKYSVKGGAKKWQIFLYEKSRFLNDFNQGYLNEISKKFIEAIECFPEDYQKYYKDKIDCKKKLKEYYEKNKKIPKNILELESFLNISNSYFSSKIKLKQKFFLIKVIFEEKKKLREFLDKALFNSSEVDFLTIKKKEDFLVFKKEDVLDVFSNRFNIYNSKSGNNKDDLNIEGQKVLFKAQFSDKLQNVVEIEIRNDSSTHYRQVRFNMIREKALEILEDSKITFKVY